MKTNARIQVDALIDGLFDNAEEIKAGMDRLDEENRLVDTLLSYRHAAGFTQRDLAAASGLSPAKICRMESGNDASLRIGDVQAYLKGLGIPPQVILPRPPRRTRPPSRRGRPAAAFA